MMELKQKRPSDVLQEALARLQEMRPSMSLRNIALKLEITPSYLSKILNGKNRVPHDLVDRLVHVLQMDDLQTNELQFAILKNIENEELTPKTGIVTDSANTPATDDHKSLSNNDFWLLEKWFYIPILNLFTVDGFVPSVQNFSKILNLEPAEAKLAVEELVEHEFVVEGENGSLIRKDRKIRFPTKKSHPAVRKYHRTMIKKAEKELAWKHSDEDFEQRLISSVCFAGSSEKLKEAKLIVEEAMYRATNLMADEPTSDKVYQLNVQLFPMHD